MVCYVRYGDGSIGETQSSRRPFHPLHQTLLYLDAEMPSLQKEEIFDTS